MALNSIIVMGRMTNDPELRTTSNGTSVTSFTVAVDRQFQKADSEKVTDFVPVVAWRGLAEFVTKYFGKGRMICVQGSLQTRKYTDKNGENRTAFEILAEHIHFTGEKKEAQSGAQSHTTASESKTIEFDEIDDSSDLPF